MVEAPRRVRITDFIPFQLFERVRFVRTGDHTIGSAYNTSARDTSTCDTSAHKTSAHGTIASDISERDTSICNYKITSVTSNFDDFDHFERRDGEDLFYV